MAKKDNYYPKTDEDVERDIQKYRKEQLQYAQAHSDEEPVRQWCEQIPQEDNE